jgi:hypothetical protein
MDSHNSWTEALKRDSDEASWPELLSQAKPSHEPPSKDATALDVGGVAAEVEARAPRSRRFRTHSSSRRADVMDIPHPAMSLRRDIGRMVPG